MKYVNGILMVLRRVIRTVAVAAVVLICATHDVMNQPKYVHSVFQMVISAFQSLKIVNRHAVALMSVLLDQMVGNVKSHVIQNVGMVNSVMMVPVMVKMVLSVPVQMMVKAARV
jgi:hypothetical protein